MRWTRVSRGGWKTHLIRVKHERDNNVDTLIHKRLVRLRERRGAHYGRNIGKDRYHQQGIDRLGLTLQKIRSVLHERSNGQCPVIVIAQARLHKTGEERMTCSARHVQNCRNEFGLKSNLGLLDDQTL